MTETTIIKELAEGRSVVLHTVGVSMLPLLIERQTHVVVAPIDTPRNKDILLYRRKNGALVLHRLIRQTEQAYYMRGDNTFGPEKTDREAIFGVVEGIYRKGKYIDTRKSKGYKVYVAFWSLIYPFRLFWMRSKLLAKMILKK